MGRTIFETQIEVAWGDCDPAGIVFYPQFFRFMDTAFQRLLADRTVPIAVMEEQFGAMGTPLVEAHATFRSPARPGDMLAIAIAGPSWTTRTMKVDYVARIGTRVVFEGYETRILGARDATGRLKALEIPAAFRMALEAKG